MPDPEDNPRGKIAAILVIVVLVAGSLWLVHRLGEAGAIQDCVATGHRDCGQRDTNAP